MGSVYTYVRMEEIAVFYSYNITGYFIPGGDILVAQDEAVPSFGHGHEVRHTGSV